MSDLLHPGLHLDADALSAFAEGVLPAHERSQALTHLAACEHCRHILFLARQAAPLPPPAPAPFWTRWLNGLPMLGIGLGAAALAGAALIFVTLRPHPNSVPSLAARVPETLQPSSPPPPTTSATPAKPQPSALKGTGFSPHESAKRERVTLAPEGGPRPVARPMPMQPPTSRAFLGTGMGGGIGRAPTVAIPAPIGSMAMSSSQGDAASRANSALDSLQSPAAVPQSPAAVPQPMTVTLGTAAAAPAAPPSSAAETVTVQDTAALTTDSARLANTLPMAAAAKARSFQRTLVAPAPLPSKLPAAATVSSGQRTLATDTAGALFLSLDSGLHWTPVAAQWPGKVAQLRLAPAPPALFQLVTTTGAVWLSVDGLHWQPQ